MPIIKSAKKRAKQAVQRQARNSVVKRDLKQVAKRYLAAIEAKDRSKAQKLLSELQSAIDKAVKKHLLHKNNAARQKASYAAKLKSMTKTANKTPGKSATKK